MKSRLTPFLPQIVTALVALAALLGSLGKLLDRDWAVSLSVVVSAVAGAFGVALISWLRDLDQRFEVLAHNPGSPGDDLPLTPGATSLLRTVGRLKRRLDGYRTVMERYRGSLEGQTEVLEDAAESTRTALSRWTHDSTSQLHAVKRVNSSWDQVNDMAERIANQAEDVERASSQASSSCESGATATLSAVEEMDRVRDSVLDIAERMRRLRSVSEQVEETARAIDQVSTQINLLALNAAIEAAGAGEYGERFGVVAVEVKQLADQTVEATKMIKGLLHTIREEVSGGIQLTERGALSVQKGYAQVRQLESLLREILSVVEQTDRSAKNILSSTKVQVFAVRNARKEVSGIEAALIGGEGGEQTLRIAVDNLFDVAGRLRSLEPRS